MEGGNDNESFKFTCPVDLVRTRISDNPLEAALAQIQSPNGSPRKLILKSNLTPSPESPSNKDYDTPLAKRLARRYEAILVTPSIRVTPPPARRVASVVVGELANHQEGTVDCVTEKWVNTADT